MAKLKGSYPNINVTMDDHKVTNPKFPSVYLHFLSPIETGKDLDGADINAVYLTAQIDVTVADMDNKMTVAKKVSQVVTDCMKDMRFSATLPEFMNTDSEYRTVSRFAREIGNADTLFKV